MYFSISQHTAETGTVCEPQAKQSLQRVESWLRHQMRQRSLIRHKGFLNKVIEHGNAEHAYCYDSNGDLINIEEANGAQVHYRYDEKRRLKSLQYDDGETTHYHYDENDRLYRINDRGRICQYSYNNGTLYKCRKGRNAQSVYRYDDQGRVVMARTSQVTTKWNYDANGRVINIAQSYAGVTLNVALRYDSCERLATMMLPGENNEIHYHWDKRGKLKRITVNDKQLVEYGFDDKRKTTSARYANGVVEEKISRSTDGRLDRHSVKHQQSCMLERALSYNELGEVITDGDREYEYDVLGRLHAVNDNGTGQRWRYAYDAMDNRIHVQSPESDCYLHYDRFNRIDSIGEKNEPTGRFKHDRWGRLTHKITHTEAWSYLYNDADCLQEVRCQGRTMVRFVYDHKGKLVYAEFADRVERYVYGPSDELLAVTDGKGVLVRSMVTFPFGLVAEVHGNFRSGEIYFIHSDQNGSTRLITDANGDSVAQFDPCPFGVQAVGNQFVPRFGGHLWFEDVGLYYCGARWYDPYLGRFITADSYTGGPDDERIVNPFQLGTRQLGARSQILNEWLKNPRVRNRYAYGGNDPVGHVDPNGHWSFGGVLLSLLGAIWTLPNTLFGLIVEITCLVSEVIRWIVWLLSFGHVSWETPGFDAAASGRLNAFALVFSGGWLGSFSSLLGITFGNVFFVYKNWETHSYITSLPDPVYPPAYGGSVSIPRDEVLYEHELRHTNQYGWFGPFFHLGLPLFGVYEWDVIFNGYANAWLERDAREHAEP